MCICGIGTYAFHVLAEALHSGRAQVASGGANASAVDVNEQRSSGLLLTDEKYSNIMSYLDEVESSMRLGNMDQVIHIDGTLSFYIGVCKIF